MAGRNAICYRKQFSTTLPVLHGTKQTQVVEQKAARLFAIVAYPARMIIEAA